MKKALLTLMLALLLLAMPALAVPEPSDDFYVLDEANVLSVDTETHIIANNDLLYEACGAQIVFVTVDTTGSTAIDDYCNDLFDAWGIGSSAENNGFLVLLAIDDDNYYALPGSGLESRLSAGDIKLMLDDDLEPDFAAKNYDAGARKLFDSLFNEISDIYSAGLATSVTSDFNAYGNRSSTREVHAANLFSIADAIMGIVLLILIIAVAYALFSRSTRRRHGPSVPPPPHHHPPIIHMGPRPGLGPRPGPGPRPPRTPDSRHDSFGGMRMGGGGRSGGFGSSRRSGGFGGSRRSGGGGSRSGGGGRSRGGGVGRGR